MKDVQEEQKKNRMTFVEGANCSTKHPPTPSLWVQVLNVHMTLNKQLIQPKHSMQLYTPGLCTALLFTPLFTIGLERCVSLVVSAICNRETLGLLF